VAGGASVGGRFRGSGEAMMITLHVSITNIAPSKLFLIRWAAKLAGATIVVCRKKVRKETTCSPS